MHHSMCETLGKLQASETYDVLMCSYNPLPINFVLRRIYLTCSPCFHVVVKWILLTWERQCKGQQILYKYY